MDKENLRKALDVIGQDFIKELTYQIIKHDKVASGRLLNSLDYQIIETLEGFLLEINYSPYLIFIDQGRKPGKFPPPDVIKQWIRDRNITPDKMTEDQLAFLIGRKIANEGIKPTHILRDTIEKIYNYIDNIILQGLSLDIDIKLNDNNTR